MDLKEKDNMDKAKAAHISTVAANVRNLSSKGRDTMHNIGFSLASARVGVRTQNQKSNSDQEPSPLPKKMKLWGNVKKRRGRVEDFAPELIVRYLSQREEEGQESVSTPVIQRMETVAMFADISGFTKLTEYLDVSAPHSGVLPSC